MSENKSEIEKGEIMSESKMKIEKGEIMSESKMKEVVKEPNKEEQFNEILEGKLKSVVKEPNKEEQSNEVLEGKLKAVVKEPGKAAEVKNIRVSLESLQRIVKGMIEIVGFPDLENVDVVVNEEGKLIGEKPNIYLPEYEDLLVGSLAVIGFDEITGEHTSLSEEQIEKVLEYIELNDATTYKGKIENYMKYDFYVM